MKNTTQNNQQPLSIVLLAGPPRSGTTWLSREICNEATSFKFLPECTLLTQQVELYSRTLLYCDQQRFSAYFSNKQNLVSYYRDNVAKMLDLIVSINDKSDANILVLKDPGLSLCLNEAMDLFPPHKLIVLMRDPRDVLASMKNVAARKGVPWDLQNTVNTIFSYYYKIENYKQEAGKDSMFVRYEDLVVDGLDKIRSFINRPVANRPFGESKMDEVREVLNTSDPFFSDLYLQSTTQKKIGSYKEILTSSEIGDIEEVFSGVIVRWGY